MSEQTKSETTGRTSSEPYTAHKKQTPHGISPVTYEPIEPQNKVQRTFGYLLLLAVSLLSPTSALFLMIWQSIRSLFGW